MSTTNQIYRVDKFHVPNAGEVEFLARVRETHQLLRKQTGFIDHRLLKQTDGPGRFNFVTIVIWENSAAMMAARDRIAAHQRESGFNPQEFRERHGIEADVASYAAVDL